MNHNTVIFRIPVTTYKEITLSKGMCVLLKHALFPPLQWNDQQQIEIRPNTQKVLAIKAVRADTGLGLKDAKDLVDAMTLEILDGVINAHSGVAPSVDIGVQSLGERLRTKVHF